MLFHGDSGIGKTSAAYALAYDLGCAVDEDELGGVFEIPSGSQTAESVSGRFWTCSATGRSSARAGEF